VSFVPHPHSMSIPTSSRNNQRAECCHCSAPRSHPPMALPDDKVQQAQLPPNRDDQRQWSRGTAPPNDNPATTSFSTRDLKHSPATIINAPLRSRGLNTPNGANRWGRSPPTANLHDGFDPDVRRLQQNYTRARYASAKQIIRDLAIRAGLPLFPRGQIPACRLPCATAEQFRLAPTSSPTRQLPSHSYVRELGA